MALSKYPEGMLEFVKENAAGRSTYELAEMINKQFGSGTINREKLRAYMKNRKIKNGLNTTFKKGQTSFNKGLTWNQYGTKEGHERSRKTTFKKNNKPHNHKEVGETSMTTAGYHITKIKEKGIQKERWVFTHRLIWEKENGPVPPGKMVEFADGDKNNLDINNLILTDREEHLELVRIQEGERHDGNITKTQLNLARLRIATRKKKRKIQEET